MPLEYELPVLLKKDMALDQVIDAVQKNLDHIAGVLRETRTTATGASDDAAASQQAVDEIRTIKQGNESSGGNQLGDDESMWGIGVDAGILAVSKTSAVATTIPTSPDFDLYNVTVSPNTYTFAVDRPMNVFAIGYVVLQNTSASTHGARLIFRVTDPDANVFDGDRSANWFENDSHNRQVMNIRTFTAYTPGEYLVQWGLQSDSGAFGATVGDRKLLLLMSYAPSASAQETPGDPNWTDDAATSAAYGSNV